MTQEINLIENYVKEELGDEFKGINFVPNFLNFDIDIVILTYSRGFIKFSICYQDLLDKTSEEVHEYIFNGIKEAIENAKPRET